MADFRKLILALSVLALVFTGVAGAQAIGGGAGIVCNTTSQPLTLRNEGYTELIGDIVLTCTGGSLQPVGSVIQPVNVTVQLPYTVTSREIGSGSEALLLLDEPGSTQYSGFGPSAPQQLCQTPLSGCEAWVADNGTYYFAANFNGTAVAPNVYSGVTGSELGTNPSQVTFFGVPLLAPVTTGQVTYERIIRITNVRLNAQGAVGGGTSYQSVTAQVSINNSNITINNSAPIVGYQQQSLIGTFRDNNNHAVNATALPQCVPETNYAVAYLRFSELFGDAFKTRVAGNIGASSAGSEGMYPATVIPPPPAWQDIPGGVGTSYGYSESDFNSGFPGTGSDTLAGTGAIYCGNGLTGVNGTNCSVAGTLTSSKGFIAGLADYGTRLKAVFNNIPTGVSVYVAAINENDGASTVTGTNWEIAAPESWGNSPAGGASGITAANYSPELAYLVTGETTVDTTTIPAATPTFSAVPSNVTVTAPIPFYQVDNLSTPKAVWEVIQALSNSIENFDFGVYVTYGTGLPPQSGITATLSYAPTPTAANVTAYSSDSNSLTIPRFAPESANPNSPYFFSIAACNTVLLFPYITTAGYVEGTSGFDTGISIANTSADPFNTPTSSGLCSLYFYGNIPVDSITAPPATYPLQSNLGAGGISSSVPIWPGTIAVTDASQTVPAGWSGYMIASCNFQFAHGYAVVSDIGVRNIMSSYLALVIADPGSTASRGSNFVGFTSSEDLNN